MVGRTTHRWCARPGSGFASAKPSRSGAVVNQSLLRQKSFRFGNGRTESTQGAAQLGLGGEVLRRIAPVLQPVGVAFGSAALQWHFISYLNRDF